MGDFQDYYLEKVRNLLALPHYHGYLLEPLFKIQGVQTNVATFWLFFNSLRTSKLLQKTREWFCNKNREDASGTSR